jgi:two-component system OmpR family response regulator
MDGYGKRILVVNENVGRRALLEAQLEQEGYAVQTACDGVAGADGMRQRHFEAVIADGHVPGFNNHEFAAFCRSAWPGTPVILLFGDLIYVMDYTDEVDAVAWLRGPFEAAMLLSVLRTVTQPVLTEQGIFFRVRMTYQGSCMRQHRRFAKPGYLT